jgi:BirA family biotin operon repressor/biotin-[acetyl-CoA-carboxylase] ligase
MSTKAKLLALLEKNRDKSLSGEDIARSLGVSRAAVWKAVRSLKSEGFLISAAPNRGYSLSEESSVLSVQGLIPYLTKESRADNIHIYKTLESTNKTAKEMAINGCAHGTVVIADGQTAGRGRSGKSFYAPPGSGLYMSLVMRLERFQPRTTTWITGSAAVAVCRAIQKVSGRDAKIKWVNDILLDGKKICGVLTEAVTDFESGGIEWVVVGIGININTADFPEELKSTAGTLYSEKVPGSIRNRIAAEVINFLLDPGTWLNYREVHDEYKKRLTLLGDRVSVIQPGETAYEAVAVDIDDDGRLIVEKDDGQRAVLSSGEIAKRIP